MTITTDTGTNGNFFTLNNNTEPITIPIKVQFSNKPTLTSTQESVINMFLLLSTIQNHSSGINKNLLTINKFCDRGHKTIFIKKKIKIIYNNKSILENNRNTITKL